MVLPVTTLVVRPVSLGLERARATAVGVVRVDVAGKSLVDAVDHEATVVSERNNVLSELRLNYPAELAKKKNKKKL